MAVDRLNIVAHDRFQEIIDDAGRPDSPIRLQTVVIDPKQLEQKTVTVISQSRLDTMLGVRPAGAGGTTVVAGESVPLAFARSEEQAVAQVAMDEIRRLQSRPDIVPSAMHLSRPEVQAAIVKAVDARMAPAQLQMDGVLARPDVAAVVAKTVDLVAKNTIDIPRVVVVPTGDVQTGFRPFVVDVAGMNYPPVSDELWVQHLRTRKLEVISLGQAGVEEERPENYVVSGLVDFDDVSYDAHADLLYELAGQVVAHLRTYLSDDDLRKVLRCYQRDIARFVHAQMIAHRWEEASGYEVKVNKGFSDLKPGAYSAGVREAAMPYGQPPEDKSNMARYVFTGFRRCLYDAEKFQSDPERRLAVILDRDAIKWFRPRMGQFQIWYPDGNEQREYQPDFVAEDTDAVFMIEAKAANQMDDKGVLAKRDAALAWCRNASEFTATYGGKPWTYVLIPHDQVAENRTLTGLVAIHRVRQAAG